MSKINLPNQKKLYQKLNNRLARYVGMVQAIYDSLNLEASKIAVDTEHTDGEFHFSDYPETKKRVDDLQSEFVNNISSVIFQGTSREWKESNLMQDLLADKVYKRYLRERDGEKQEVYYQTNNDALKAFQQRKDRGLNLSQKLWKQSGLYKEELETAISTAIERGTDAITLSKKISQYLNDFPSLQKDYTEKFGHASKANDCEYRSIRLARSEINMAYRKAEQLRWQQMDFVVGYEIHLSNSHPKEDICDRLAGKYPKDFVWTGWHPNCMDYKTSILKDEDEFFDLDNETSRNEVTDVPDAFKEWVSENDARIALAEKHGTLPYFLRDNMDRVNEIRKPKKKEKEADDKKPEQKPKTEKPKVEKPKVDTPIKGNDVKQVEPQKNMPIKTTDNKHVEDNKTKENNILTPEEKQRRKEIEKEAKLIVHGKELLNTKFKKTVTMSNGKVKEWLNQPFGDSKEIYLQKNEALLNIENVFRESKYIGWGYDEHDARMKMHLFETKIGTMTSWIIVCEETGEKYVIRSITALPEILNHIVKFEE